MAPSRADNCVETRQVGCGREKKEVLVFMNIRFKSLYVHMRTDAERIISVKLDSPIVSE